MHIFVINLRESIARRDAIERQLRGLGLSYELFPAITGNGLSLTEKAQHYDETWFVRNEGRPAQPGELGCALSHIAVYRLILERNLPHALILEDDAWLNPNLPELLEAIAQKYAQEERNIILLTWYRALSLRKVESLWLSYHVAEARSAVCAHGYVVTNAAACALVEVLYPIRHLADCWAWLRRHHIVSVWAVFPTCITADLSYQSSIREPCTNHRQRSLMERLIRRVYRGFWSFYDYVLAMIRRVER